MANRFRDLIEKKIDRSKLESGEGDVDEDGMAKLAGIPQGRPRESYEVSVVNPPEPSIPAKVR